MTNRTVTVVSTPCSGSALKGTLEYSETDGTNPSTANATMADNSGAKSVNALNTVTIYIQTPVYVNETVAYIPVSYATTGATNNAHDTSGSITGQGDANFIALSSVVTPTMLDQNVTVTITWAAISSKGGAGTAVAIVSGGPEGLRSTSVECPVCGCCAFYAEEGQNSDHLICGVCGYRDTGRELTET